MTPDVTATEVMHLPMDTCEKPRLTSDLCSRCLPPGAFLLATVAPCCFGNPVGFPLVGSNCFGCDLTQLYSAAASASKRAPPSRCPAPRGHMCVPAGSIYGAVPMCARHHGWPIFTAAATHTAAQPGVSRSWRPALDFRHG